MQMLVGDVHACTLMNMGGSPTDYVLLGGSFAQHMTHLAACWTSVALNYITTYEMRERKREGESVKWLGTPFLCFHPSESCFEFNTFCVRAFLQSVVILEMSYFHKRLVWDQDLDLKGLIDKFVP